MAASDADLLHPVGGGDADCPVQQLSVDQLPDRICRSDHRIDFLFYPVRVDGMGDYGNFDGCFSCAGVRHQLSCSAGRYEEGGGKLL